MLIWECGRQIQFKPGTSIKKAAAAISAIVSKNGLRARNILWQDKAQYEHEVNILQRFLVDASVSGGPPCIPSITLQALPVEAILVHNSYITAVSVMYAVSKHKCAVQVLGCTCLLR